jgi:hypothetical protein
VASPGIFIIAIVFPPIQAQSEKQMQMKVLRTEGHLFFQILLEPVEKRCGWDAIRGFNKRQVLNAVSYL